MIANRMIRPKAARELSYYSPAHDRWYEGSKFFNAPTTESGLTVTSESALRLITVQNCVRMRATTLSRLPCHVMQRNGEKRQRATDFYLYEKLHDQPNDWMTSNEFWAMAEAHKCLRGNFYAYKMGIPGRPIQQLIPLNVDAVQKVEQQDDYSLIYFVKFKDGLVYEIPGEKILHFRGLTLDGITGMNPIEYARETIGRGMASEQFVSRFFGKGLNPGTIIKHPLPLTNQAFANRRDQLKERYEGLGKTRELMLLDEGMDITWPDIKLVDAQFIEQMKLSDAQIAGLYRVPLMLINQQDNAPTYASAEQFLLFYQMFSIDCMDYESSIRRDLLTSAERKKYYAKFSLEGLLRGGMKDRAEFYQTLINSEVLSPNEARAYEDLNPYDGGDEFRTRTSTTRSSGGSDSEPQKEEKQ
jgi:HK97 family phage portal protein